MSLQAPWPFYLALSLFRLASILAGVGARAAQGNASSRSAAQMGSHAVVRSLACRGLEIAGQLPAGGGLGGDGSRGSAALDSDTSGGASSHLMGTPAEPFANPRHPSARPDTTPNILAGNELEEYANPTPEWRQAAGAAAAALAEADRVLPARSPPTSGSSVRQHPTAGSSSRSSATRGTAAAAAGVAATGLGPSPRVQPLLRRLQAFMDEFVYPAGRPGLGGCPAAALLCHHRASTRIRGAARPVWLLVGLRVADQPNKPGSIGLNQHTPKLRLAASGPDAAGCPAPLPQKPR
jgi:hypothetical protein